MSVVVGEGVISTVCLIVYEPCCYCITDLFHLYILNLVMWYIDEF